MLHPIYGNGLTPDCTQYGLIGSTEWAEDFADWIQGHAVAYINVGEYHDFGGLPELAI